MPRTVFSSCCLLALVLAAWPRPAAAQAQVSAQVDRDTIGQDETVELTVIVAGGGPGGAPEPKLPTLHDFQVVGTATQQSVSLIGASMQVSVNYAYELQPLRTGALTIPAIKLTMRGRTYTTDPITVTVTKGTGRSQPQNPWGVGPGFTPSLPDIAGSAQAKHSVDHQTAYVGQQITYTFSFLHTGQIYDRVRHETAATPGFVAEKLPYPPETEQVISGQPYRVAREMIALFATSPGKHTIGQAGVSVTLDPVLGEEEFTAKPITVDVLPLPAAGQPAGFGGAVGSFTARLRLDRPAVRAGETVNCVIDITGDGNIRSLGAPQLALPDWVRVYKAGENRSVKPGGGSGGPTVIGGTASFSYLLLPRQAGALRVGPVTYPYFDPSAHAYRMATSSAVDLAVTPGSGAIAPVAPADSLRPIKTDLGRPAGRPVASSPVFWIGMAFPLLAVLGMAWQRRQEARLLAAPRQARADRALALAYRRFDAAEQALTSGNRDAFYAGLHEALLDYIADRTGAPPSGLTADVAHDRLVERGADAELAALARALIDRTAAGRFAPGASDAQKAEQLLVQCRQTLKALQREVRPDA